jgi:hypothetical protein
MPQPQIRIVQAASVAKQRRKPRRPQHPFNVVSRPFELTPFLIAPVLPGETMQNLLLQSRVVSDPVLNPLIGWHKEYFFYYVPLRALAHPDVGHLTMANILALFTAGTALAAPVEAANDTAHYQFKGGIDWLGGCLKAIAFKDFRDENDLNLNIMENYPTVYADRNNIFNSMKLESAIGDDQELPGIDEIEELDILPGYSNAYAQWEIMRDSGFTDVTFEDYLRSAGVSVPQREDLDDVTGVPAIKPELIRFSRSWTYPTNHVEPTTGVPSSALSWSIAERADKKRFFKEPGFVVGVTSARPKIYLGNQKGASVGLLKTINHWLPPVLQGFAYTSVVEELDTLTDGILQNQTEDYWFDIRDLYLYGDQFTNQAMSAANNYGLSLPDATVDNKSLVTLAMAKSLFSDSAGTKNFIREDGVVHMNILSQLGDDETPA